MTEVVGANGHSSTSVEETSSEVVREHSIGSSVETSTGESKEEVSVESVNGDSPLLDDEDTPVDQIQVGVAHLCKFPLPWQH